MKDIKNWWNIQRIKKEMIRLQKLEQKGRLNKPARSITPPSKQLGRPKKNLAMKKVKKWLGCRKPKRELIQAEGLEHETKTKKPARSTTPPRWKRWLAQKCLWQEGIIEPVLMESDRTRDLTIIDDLNTLLQGNITADINELLKIVLRSHTAAMMCDSPRRDFTSFKLFSLTNPPAPDIVKDVHQNPDARQALIRKMFISALQKSNPGNRLDLGPAQGDAIGDVQASYPLALSSSL